MPILEFQGSQGLGPQAGFDGIVKTRDCKSESEAVRPLGFPEEISEGP